jgi:hypothetical protein
MPRGGNDKRETTGLIGTTHRFGSWRMLVFMKAFPLKAAMGLIFMTTFTIYTHYSILVTLINHKHNRSLNAEI